MSSKENTIGSVSLSLILSLILLRQSNALSQQNQRKDQWKLAQHNITLSSPLIMQIYFTMMLHLSHDKRLGTSKDPCNALQSLLIKVLSLQVDLTMIWKVFTIRQFMCRLLFDAWNSRDIQRSRSLHWAQRKSGSSCNFSWRKINGKVIWEPSEIKITW